jgi:spermidine synthase
MGATLPLLSLAVVGAGTRRSLANRAGTLYGLNTLGAVIGAAATPFVALPALGVSSTGFAVALADLLVAALACAAARLVRSAPPEHSPVAALDAGAGPGESAVEIRRRTTERRSPARARAAVLLIAASGAVAMVYQQVWARFLTLVIGSSVYAVSLILAVFLLGLALGAATYSRRTALRPGQASNLAVAHLFVAAWSIATALLGDHLPAAFVVGLSLAGVTVTKVLLLQAALTVTVVLAPTFFMGMAFPATLRIVELNSTPLDAGRVVGWVYSRNTLGSIVGSFIGGFVVLPALGVQGALIGCALSSVGLALGYAALVWASAGWRRSAPAVAAAFVAIGLCGLAYRPWNLAVLSSGVFRVSRSADLATALGEWAVVEDRRAEALPEPLRPWVALGRSVLAPGDLWDDGLGPEVGRPSMLSHRSGLTATVAVTESRARSWLPGHDWVSLSLRVNGKADASLTVLTGLPPGDAAAISPQGDAETQVLSGLLPTLLHPGRPSSALVIGWGSGVTTGAALSSGVERVRAVEIEREVVRGSTPFQAYAGWPLRSPRLELVEDDGRRLLSARDERYDIVISEPSNPWISGCSNLFTVEFFSLVASRLNERGRFLQWVQAYEISTRTLVSILAALRRVFSSVVVFRPAHSPADLLIVAGNDPVVIDWRAIDERLRRPPIAAWLTRFGVIGPEDIAARLLLDTRDLDRLTRGVPPNTDDNLLVELAAPYDLVQFRDAGGANVVLRLGAGDGPPERAMVGAPDGWRDRLRDALERTGRGARGAPPALDALALIESPTPEQRAFASVEDPDAADLGRLASTLDIEAQPGRGLAVLGVAAVRSGELHLGALFLAAHCRSGSPVEPRAAAVLAALLLDSGFPARAWNVRCLPGSERSTGRGPREPSGGESSLTP